MAMKEENLMEGRRRSRRVGMRKETGKDKRRRRRGEEEEEEGNQRDVGHRLIKMKGV